MIASATSFNTTTSDALHALFMTLVPTIESHGQVMFRHLKCQAKREDAIQEMVALCWKWVRRLVQQGKDPAEFPSALATFAARAVKSGRRLARMETPRDVLSERAQRLHGFTVQSLPISTRTSHENLFAAPHGQDRQDAFEERLRDNTQTPVPDQAAFRIDFPAWLDTLTGRERRLIRAMARNERTKDLSKEFELSPGRVSQMRREFHQGWTQFTADQNDCQTAPSAAH